MSKPALQLSNLGEWAVERTNEIYFAKSMAEAKQAIEKFFAPHVKATVNGRPVSRDDIDTILLGMRPTEEGNLGFFWTDLVYAARDRATQRDGSLGGVYVITGVKVLHPQTGELIPSFRRKSVSIDVESQSDDLAIDSRKIVGFATVAHNFPLEELDHQEKLRWKDIKQYSARL
ncbi:hypothetical protein GYMLUDRAFT_1017843 [Collybiopsis luxurians FD-317 M1]|uniref:Uncharacterized protein n=1 Tax=Collybiopsis luxurians FD-317 M1 TaxID=944289 RepID=A0A0D0CKD8_9AGAR|nr:hypothetical protein GYMLUDRAFT_1017843 [Collybiopsis luxurians FD-317 M1]